MKFITLTLVSLLIGCAGQETPPATTGKISTENSPELPENPSPVLESNVASQTVLTCSKDGSEDVVYTAKTYAESNPCKKDEGLANVRSCVCEVFVDDIVLLMATRTKDWCADSIDTLKNNQNVSISYQGGQNSIKPLHDASYSCSRQDITS